MSLGLALMVAAIHLVMLSFFMKASGERLGLNIPTCLFAGIFLFHDLPNLVDALGASYQSRLFQGISEADGPELFILTAMLLIAPLCFIVGYFIALPKAGRVKITTFGQVEMSPIRSAIFIALGLGLSVGCAVFSINAIADAEIWSVRSTLGASMGVFFYVLLIPMFFLVYFLTTKHAQGTSGHLLAFIFATGAAVSALPMGERTFVLLPFLLLALLWARENVSRIAIAGMGGLVAAAMLLPHFKWQHSGAHEPDNVLELGAKMANGDLARSPVLLQVIRSTSIFSNQVMPFPFSGLINAFLLPVPRSLAPIKGFPSASHLTSSLTGEQVEDLTWGVGVGFVEEGLLNGGYLWSVAIFLLYGVAYGWAARLSDRHLSLRIPSCLSAIWLWGYSLMPLFIVFGMMASFGLLMELLFAGKVRRAPRFFRNVTSPP